MAKSEADLDIDADSDADSTCSGTSPDCAVGLFSDTFSLPCQSRYRPIVLNAPTTRVAMKTSLIATSFPAEVLLIIFKLVHHQERRANDDLDWPSKEDNLSPSLFPYAIAAVCPYWRDIMSLAPEFWTRVVILVDQHATPLPAVECLLAWSRDLSLNVAVTRRMDTYAAEDKDESARANQVISRLLPHLHRFRNLSFDVVLSSSLPSFPNDFKGSAPLLQSIKLECREDDGGAPQSDDQNKATTTSTPLDTQTEHEGFQCPALRRLIIDGRSFYNAGRMGPSWSGMLSGVVSLIVSHFRPRDGEVLTICDFMIALKPIQRLFDLTIIDLQIDMSESPLASYEEMEEVNLPHLETLDVRDLECFEPIDTILCAVGTRLKLTAITRCVTSHVQGFRGSLHLEDISGNILQLLRCWNGKELFITRCPGVNDHTLEDIGYRHANCARNLHSLFIYDCPNISSVGLKQLVRDRRSLSDSDGQFPLKKLSVSWDVPHITPKDRLWFTKKLRRFGYRNPDLFYRYSEPGPSDGPGSDSDGTDSEYGSDDSVSDTSSRLTNYSL